MLNWPISAWKTSSAIAARTSSLRIAGSCRASTRLNSISDAGQRTLEVELRLVEHPAEHVQAAPELLPVAQAVRARERPGLDLFAHEGRLPSVQVCGQVGTQPAGRHAERQRGRPSAAALSRRGVRVRVTDAAAEGDDVKVTDSWYSERLEQPIGLARWGHYGTPGPGLPHGGRGRRGDRAQRPRRRLLAAHRERPDQALLLRQRGRPGDGGQGRDAGVPDVAVQPVPPRRPARGRARRSGPTWAAPSCRSSRPAPPSGRSTRSRCSAGSRTCSAPPSA